MHGAGGGVVPADDLLLGRVTADGVVRNAVAYHVHAHVRRAFIGLTPYMRLNMASSTGKISTSRL